MSAHRVFWKDGSSDQPMTFVTFVQIFSNEMATGFKRSALVANPAHAVLLNFIKDYKTRLIQNRHSLVGILPHETEMSEGVIVADIGELRKSVDGYFLFQVFDSEESMQLTSGASKRERKMHAAHRSIRMVLDDQ